MNFEQGGFTVLDQVVSESECEALIAALPPIESSGTRLLMAISEFQELAHALRLREGLGSYLEKLVAVQCIHFRKTISHNWSVAPHRDSVLPVNGVGKWTSAGSKEGMSSVRPPREFMDRCVAVRVHLDGAPVEDISVVPGSHLDDQKYDHSRTVPIAVRKGGALVLRPTLFHASSKLSGHSERRVLHYVYAPRELPYGYDWHVAA